MTQQHVDHRECCQLRSSQVHHIESPPLFATLCRDAAHRAGSSASAETCVSLLLF